MSERSRDDKEDNIADRGSSEPPLRRVDSKDLFRNAREIIIDHNGKAYRLRVTSLGKLILTL